MVSGFDRYFQIARCFRDEDLRANRQPEFTQLDVEMSFVDDHDVTSTMEILVAAMAREFSGEEITLPLPRLDYHDVMERFGSDRPDLRYRPGAQGPRRRSPSKPSSRSFDRPSSRSPDPGNLRAGRRRPLQPQGPRRPDRVIAGMGAKGLVWLKVEPDTLTGPTAKFFSADLQQQLRTQFGAKPGDLILIVADTQAVSSLALSSLRSRLAAELKLYDPKSFHYSWIVRFPLFALGRRGEAVRRRAPPVHDAALRRLASCSIPSRPRCGLRRMTWSSTARNAAAARSAATTP